MLMDLPPSLATARLLLRAPSEGDGDSLREAIACSLERLAPQLGWAQRLLDEGEVPDLASSAAAAAARFLGGSEPSYYVWLDADPSPLIGELLLRRAAGERVELGLWIRTGYQGKGYGMEACDAAMSMLGRRGVRRYLADCRADNPSATRLLEAAGFTATDTRQGRVIYHLDLP